MLEATILDVLRDFAKNSGSLVSAIVDHILQSSKRHNPAQREANRDPFLYHFNERDLQMVVNFAGGPQVGAVGVFGDGVS